ncbi:MAG: abortive infection family protein [Xanthobacteraceae bacterium]
MAKAPLSDAIIVAVSQLVDDAQADRREPSHSDLEFEIKRAGLTAGDPKNSGQTVGKAKRVRAVLSWAYENEFDQGQIFVSSLISNIRGHGGFRASSPNFVGTHAIEHAASAFASEGYELTLDGELQPRLLENLSGTALTDALQGYVTRAKRGASDAALVTGTGKDLLEAVAAYILQQRYGGYSATSNFPTLLGQVFVALGLATTADPIVANEPPSRRIERATYELACGINQLRNKQGTGHGRPWGPTITEAEARMAIESMGIIAERLLNLHRGIK